MIKLDGNYGEGGGAIVRTALALSTLTGKPFRITNIRKGRSKPGLKNQHLTGIKVLKQLCNASTEGDELGSERLIYKPKKIKYQNLNIDIGTAGSITLLMQAILPVLLFSNKKIKIQIIGGTDTKWSPPIDYFLNVFLPHLRKYAEFETSLERRGYYPKGGGKVTVKIKPKYSFSEIKEAKPIELTDQGKLLVIYGVSHSSKELMKANVADRQAKMAKYILSKLDCGKKITVEYVDSSSIGSGITLWALFSDKDELNFDNPVIIGSDSLGERGKKAEKVGQEAAENLIEQIDSKAAVDKYLTDQSLIYLALFGGKINCSEISNHAKTNMYVIEKFLDVKFNKKNTVISI